MSTQIQAGTWTDDGGELLSQPLLNFIARRRIAISLIGFLSLMLLNLLWRRTVPLSPLDIFQAASCLALSLIGTGLAIRSWSAGCLNKSREVTRHGPYALTRNPLYIGSFLMMFGFCVLLKDLPALLFVAGPMTFLYWLQVRFEEKRLLFLFPDAWPSYMEQVPRFFPRNLPAAAWVGWTRAEWLRNREYRAIAASLAGLVAIQIWHFVSQRWW